MLTPLNLSWATCQGNVWCSLERVDLSTVRARGVYLIWHAGNPPRAIYVGQGDIAERLNSHRNDKTILNYSVYGEIYVTWAEVPDIYRDGVERFLAEAYTPLVGQYFPNVHPIPVTLPNQ